MPRPRLTEETEQQFLQNRLRRAEDILLYFLRGMSRNGVTAEIGQYVKDYNSKRFAEPLREAERRAAMKHSEAA